LGINWGFSRIRSWILVIILRSSSKHDIISVRDCMVLFKRFWVEALCGYFKLIDFFTHCLYLLLDKWNNFIISILSSCLLVFKEPQLFQLIAYFVLKLEKISKITFILINYLLKYLPATIRSFNWTLSTLLSSSSKQSSIILYCFS